MIIIIIMKMIIIYKSSITMDISINKLFLQSDDGEQTYRTTSSISLEEESSILTAINHISI